MMNRIELCVETEISTGKSGQKLKFPQESEIMEAAMNYFSEFVEINSILAV